MAQTTGGMSFRAAVVYVSTTGGATWTDLSGHGASIAMSGGERASGEQNTMDGDEPIVRFGKRSSVDLTVRFVYTEEDTDPFDVVEAAYTAAGGSLYVQYRPKTGGLWYKTGAAGITSMLYPSGNVDSGDPIMCEFVVKCAALEKAAAST